MADRKYKQFKRRKKAIEGFFHGTRRYEDIAAFKYRWAELIAQIKQTKYIK